MPAAIALEVMGFEELLGVTADPGFGAAPGGRETAVVGEASVGAGATGFEEEECFCSAEDRPEERCLPEDEDDW